MHELLKLGRPLVAIDLETTSAEVNNARIVQIAYLKYEVDGRIKSYNQLVNPRYPIAPNAVEVHGISQEMVKDQPSFEDISYNILDDLVGVDFAGYNVVFDLQILIAEFNRISVKFHTVGSNIIDGYKLWTALRPRSLSDAVKEWTGEDPKNAHDALADIQMTMGVIESQAKEITLEDDPVRQLGKMGFPTLVDLAGKFGRREDGEIVFQFSKHKGEIARKYPDFLKWMMRSDFSLETKWWCKKIQGMGR